MTSQPGPVPREPKPRLLQDGRDMFWSLAPLVVACIVLAGLVGMCSFQARGPKTGPAPEYDAPAALRADAAQLGFPVRLPQLPDGWHANSGRRGSIEQGRKNPATGTWERAVISTVGYLAPSGMYLSLTQSNADEQKLVEEIYSGRCADRRAERRRSRRAGDIRHSRLLGGIRRRRRYPTGVDDTARRADRTGADCDNGCREPRRIPYAGRGHAIAAATACDSRQLARARAIGDR